jgi:hypothetical protein
MKWNSGLTVALGSMLAAVALALGGDAGGNGGTQMAGTVLSSQGSDLNADWTRSEYAAASGTVAVPVAEFNDVVQRYCVMCHNDQLQTGNLSLQQFDVAQAPDQAEIAEQMIRKLRADMMPPPGVPRPGGDTLVALVRTLEELVDEAAAIRPNPGSRPFQRLNQPEYERAIADLFGLDVDAATWLPSDAVSANFDNIADAQVLSATLMDGYLNAASEISRMVTGSEAIRPVDRVFQNSRFLSQHSWDRLPGAPYGTRGGISVVHHFPADGYYSISLEFMAGKSELLEYQDIDVSVNGEQVALLAYGGPIDFQGRREFPIESESFFVQAGHHRLTAAFVRHQDGPYEDLIRPHEFSGAGTEVHYGTTSLPHVREMTLSGPFGVTGVSESQVLNQLLTCRPQSETEAEARPCAEEILSRVATQAYRRPLQDRDLRGIMEFYDVGAEDAGFLVGLRSGLEAILASPHFIFRVERVPEGLPEDQPFRIADLDLASRLSFFLWGSAPDDELRGLAARGELSNPGVLEAQAIRMMADPRSEALGTRFAAQWLRLQDLDRVRPDAYWFPDYSEQLASSMRTETILFFNSLVQEDRSLLDLYTADYTFVNERLARHYGIPGVVGDGFRRVQYPENSARSGLLGHGSVLMLTSLGNRTSPVLRGKWVMEVLLDTPPPPPPPGVPDLAQTDENEEARVLTTRERMEMHRASPACASCHVFMDPIGLALDNFDVTGKWRSREFGMPLDTRGELWNGAPVTSPTELATALVGFEDALVRTFTLNLMAYALGRRVEYFDQPTVRRIARTAAEQDYRLSSFIMGVIQSDPFQTRLPPAFADQRDIRD